MAKMNVKLNGKKVTIDTSRPKVVSALAALIEACAERQFSIGMILQHEKQKLYQLIRIKQYDGSLRAYLVNTETGMARNSRKVVRVEEPNGGGKNGSGYTTDLPCEYDRFYDPENPSEFIDV